MTAVSYVRRSSNARAGALDVSFDSQRSAIERLATSKGDTIATEYEDRAKSGGSTNGRHGYRDMLAAIEAGGVDVVYAYALTRLTRSLGDLMDLIRTCEAHGVVIRTSQDGLDTSTSSGRGVMKLIGVVAEMEREWTKERTNGAIAVRKAKGHLLGSAGYGQRLRGGKAEKADSEDVAAVMAAYGESNKNFSLTARLLNERGIKPRWSERWSSRSVSNVIRRELGEADLPRALDQPKRGPLPKRIHPFSGLLHCGYCGGLLTGKVTTVKGKDYVSYLCGNARYLSPAQHPRPFIHSQSRFVPLVMAEADHLSIPHDVLEDIEEDTGEADRIRAAMGQVRKQNTWGDLSDEDYRTERDELQKQLDKVEARAVRRTIPPTVAWDADPADLNRTLRAVFDRIDLTPDNLGVAKFHWAVPEWRAEVAASKP